MTLQEIYKWFRENIDRVRGYGKRWKSSIRVNPKMKAVNPRLSPPKRKKEIHGDTFYDKPF